MKRCLDEEEDLPDGAVLLVEFVQENDAPQQVKTKD